MDDRPQYLPEMEGGLRRSCRIGEKRRRNEPTGLCIRAVGMGRTTFSVVYPASTLLNAKYRTCCRGMRFTTSIGIPDISGGLQDRNEITPFQMIEYCPPLLHPLLAILVWILV